MCTQPPKRINKKYNDVYSHYLVAVEQLNETLLADFLKWKDDDSVRKTHFFEDRYENIYLNETHIPTLVGLIKTAVKSAEAILQTSGLRAGYWFNYMPPGSTTTLHTHDDDDEQLSAVYYVHAPKNSGNLIIHSNKKNDSSDKFEITAEAGKFVFFKPDVPHEVSKNLSAKHRLSIGINFGKPDLD